MINSDKLASLGKFLAMKALEDNGFRGVREIAEKERALRTDSQYPRVSYGQLLATKGNRRYVIELRTRRKYQKNNKVNTRYKLSNSKTELRESALLAEQHYNAAAYWIAVQVDGNKYTIYLGSLNQLNGRTGIPMADAQVHGYECLAFNQDLKDSIEVSEEADGGQRMTTPPEILVSLVSFQRDHPDPSKAAFIMMQFGDTPAHKEIVKGIRDVLNAHGISALRADDTEYHDDLFPNVLTYIYGCSFGIAVFERIEVEQFNPNVALEVGYMMALKKPVCLLKDRTLHTLHTDLVGKLYRKFDPQDPVNTIATGLTQWMKDKHLVP